MYSMPQSPAVILIIDSDPLTLTADPSSGPNGQTVTVTDQASGIYLEPVRDTAAARRANARPPAKGPAPIPTPPRRPPSDPLRNDNFRWRP